jgi:ribosomal-protein-alanine N-acetyltransferase
MEAAGVQQEDAMNAEKPAGFRMVALAPEHIPFLEALEEGAGIPFWGADNYRRFLEEYSEYFGFCLIQEVNENRLAGFSLARAAFEDMELLKICIMPEFQRLGFGTQLLEETFAEGLRRSATRCFLEVRKSNQKAIQFYSAHVFRIAGARLNYYSNPVEDAWIMERHAAPPDG